MLPAYDLSDTVNIHSTAEDRRKNVLWRSVRSASNKNWRRQKVLESWTTKIELFLNATYLQSSLFYALTSLYLLTSTQPYLTSTHPYLPPANPTQHQPLPTSSLPFSFANPNSSIPYLGHNPTPYSPQRVAAVRCKPPASAVLWCCTGGVRLWCAAGRREGGQGGSWRHKSYRWEERESKEGSNWGYRVWGGRERILVVEGV